jgi:hypothetical protein
MQQQNQQTWTMDSQQHSQGYDPGYSEEVTRYVSHGSYDSRAGGAGGGGGGLRVANRDSTASESEDDSWKRDVLAQMNFAGGPGGPPGGNHAQ